jgi:hypothetical protein
MHALTAVLWQGAALHSHPDRAAANPAGNNTAHTNAVAHASYTEPSQGVNTYQSSKHKLPSTNMPQSHPTRQHECGQYSQNNESLTRSATCPTHATPAQTCPDIDHLSAPLRPLPHGLHATTDTLAHPRLKPAPQPLAVARVTTAALRQPTQQRDASHTDAPEPYRMPGAKLHGSRKRVPAVLLEPQQPTAPRRKPDATKH